MNESPTAGPSGDSFIFTALRICQIAVSLFAVLPNGLVLGLQSTVLATFALLDADQALPYDFFG